MLNVRRHSSLSVVLAATTLVVGALAISGTVFAEDTPAPAMLPDQAGAEESAKPLPPVAEYTRTAEPLLVPVLAELQCSLPQPTVRPVYSEQAGAAPIDWSPEPYETIGLLPDQDELVFGTDLRIPVYDFDIVGGASCLRGSALGDAVEP
jgi:hypothetical protein